MITKQEKIFLYKKKLKEGMSIKDINKYFERFKENLKLSKKMNINKEEFIDLIDKKFKENFKNLNIV